MRIPHWLRHWLYQLPEHGYPSSHRHGCDADDWPTPTR